MAEKVHRDTVYVWMARYEAEGLEGLADRSHRPHRSPLQMPAAVEARVLELRRLHPHWGPVNIWHRLGREGVEPVPSVSGVYRAPDLQPPPLSQSKPGAGADAGRACS